VTLFQELRSVAVRQSEERDFPLWLLPEVLQIADNPELYSDQCSMVELLLTQLQDFDSFAGVGCFDSSTSADTIRRTVTLITQR
jgi:hypothetical protein